MFDTLSERLRKTLGTLTGRGRISEADVDAAMREVRLALLEADVNFKVVKDFVARVREKAVGADVLESLTAGQQVVKIVHDELVDAPVGGRPDLPPVGQPGGRRDGRPPGLGQDDVHREARPAHRQAGPPAAARRRGPVPARRRRPARDARQERSTSRSSGRPAGHRVVDIARGGVEAAKRQVRDVVILDTAGRLTVDEALMAEIAAVNAAVKPVETLLVVDAMTGQEAVAVAQAFVAAVPVTGLILTKIDGDARGGAALSISRGHRRPGQVPGHRREDRRASRSSTRTASPAGSSAWATS